MLDMLNVQSIDCNAVGAVFEDTHPAQTALRTRLGSLTECELANLEQDLSYYATTGMMTTRIEDLLAIAGEDIAAAA